MTLALLALMTVTTVHIPSSVDGSEQKCQWRCPTGDEPRPLAVVLHTWSKDGKQDHPVATRWCEEKNWAFLAPDFRGPNRKPKALASDLAVQDIVDAVEWAKANARIDPERIYLIGGGAGGGSMALVMAGRHPGIWAGVASFCPVTDLDRWYVLRSAMSAGEDKPDRYAKAMAAACGDYPNPEYAKRSAATYLGAAREQGVKVYIASGIHDGRKGPVPVGQAIRGYNLLAGEADRIAESDIAAIEQTQAVPVALRFDGSDPDYPFPIHLRKTSGNVRLTLFDGGHDILLVQGLHWLEHQSRNKSAVWDLPPLEGSYPLTAKALPK